MTFTMQVSIAIGCLVFVGFALSVIRAWARIRELDARLDRLRLEQSRPITLAGIVADVVDEYDCAAMRLPDGSIVALPDRPDRKVKPS